MHEFIAVIFITILAVISPGADFAIVTKNSYLYGRKIGVITSIGIALGVLIHVAYTLIAVNLVLAYTPQILNVIKYIGAIYLIYLGYKTFIQKPVNDSSDSTILSPINAFQNGFFTNALNPKTTLFVISTYTQIISITTPQLILIGYGLFMSLAHFIWFAFVALIFSTAQLRQWMLVRQIMFNRIIGSILTLIGITLLLANFR